MKIELSTKECKYLAGKVFWDWKLIESDLRLSDITFKPTKKSIKAFEKKERFLCELYNKLEYNESRKNVTRC